MNELTPEEYEKNFDLYSVVESEGGRIGFSTCKTCGASVQVDSRDRTNWLVFHIEWHKKAEARQP